MYHTGKMVLVLGFDRYTVSAISHGYQVILEHGLLAGIADKLCKLVVQLFICQALVPSHCLET